MLALRYQYNAVLKVVSADPADPRHSDWVPVLKRDGDYRSVPWLGFIDLETIHRYPLKYKKCNAVKLPIRYYSVSVGIFEEWQKVPIGLCVQGCLADGGVYAVMEHGRPRLVRGRGKVSVPSRLFLRFWGYDGPLE